MAERIRELEAENCQQRVHIKELTNLIVVKETIYDARFRRLEAMFLHGSSSSSVLEVARPEGGNTKVSSPRKVVFVDMTIVQLDHFNDYA